MFKKILIVVGFLLMAPTAFASSTNSALLTDIWLSPVVGVAGENVTIYTGLWNESGSSLSGKVSFYVDGKQVGDSAFSASSDSLVAVSYQWPAVAGSHTAYAQIESIDGVANAAALGLINNQTKSVAITVSAPVPATNADRSSSLSSGVTNIINNIGQSLPNSPIASTLLSVATTTANAIGNGVNAVNKVADKIAGQVLGAETSAPSANSSTSSPTWQQQGLNILAFLIRNWLWVFLIIVVLVIFFAFY